MAENKVIAVDLGGTNLRVALVKGNKILNYLKVETPKQKEALINTLISSISKIITKDTKAIGIGSPGPLKKGIIINPPNLPFKNFNLQKKIQQKFKRKTIVENDANCVALAEAKFGVKKKNFIVLTLGTGVGAGVIINEKLYIGQGQASEAGHIILDKSKDLEYWWKAHRKVGMIKELIKSKNPSHKKILNELIDHLGQGIASLINVLDPEIIVLTGGARETGNKFLKMIQKSADKYKIIQDKHKIVWSKLKHPGILGAAALVQ